MESMSILCTVSDTWNMLCLVVAGTLSVSSCVTAALKSIDLRIGGYAGLMLPVCEDTGLAKMAEEVSGYACTKDVHNHIPTN